MDESSGYRFVLSIPQEFESRLTPTRTSPLVNHFPSHYISTPRSSPDGIETLIALVF